MYFRHSNEMWSEFPDLVPGVLFVEGITADVAVSDRLAKFHAIAEERLAGSAEGEMPEIQAWRRTFSKMGLKPTQYRCASEALLRRFRQEKSLPQLHPLVDLCNAISIAFAIPVAVFDLAKISGDLEVRHATGRESYLTFAGETEHPEPREVIFADSADRAHARRWTNRQSGLSAVREDTRSLLIVAEAMHEAAGNDVPRLIATLAAELAGVWSVDTKTGMLSRSSPRFDL
ncbi:B3/B4 domain-containing protein [Rhizobium sp. LEGMi198b]|uniref:B3/B4 domain-containing protein n=1 Tax=unclassified Rhizobium TaxID=2613769 RepID=UPI000CDF3995|nr:MULTISPECIES: phenylalanine--tRNA ligase beta subunit-related protein [Rhizobium]AVA22228.1 phenylalanyl-tRNA synthetase B3/B4 family protein [Rhizobium sp. NXC24]MDK4738714.1 phenylalanine--tRNA ligase beta subunit-related protein [Rhizobium sp. CNPSo 3464]UWU19674.1 phenylalanine--tRNA ligase beta subunit-related protein [Rhizobium tropici]